MVLPQLPGENKKVRASERSVVDQRETDVFSHAPRGADGMGRTLGSAWRMRGPPPLDTPR